MNFNVLVVTIILTKFQLNPTGLREEIKQELIEDNIARQWWLSESRLPSTWGKEVINYQYIKKQRYEKKKEKKIQSSKEKKNSKFKKKKK